MIVASAKRRDELTESQQATLAVGLLFRASEAIHQLAKVISQSQQGDASKLSRAMDALATIHDQLIDEYGPDRTWFREFYLLCGEHAVLTEEGWIDADQNTQEATGGDPMEVLDEVNAPQ